MASANPAQNFPANDGKLSDNIVYFARALRRAGVKVGTSQVENAIAAVALAGFSHRVDFYYTLRATLINRPEHLQTYHQIFNLFWRDPEYLERMMRTLLPMMQTMRAPETAPKGAERRALGALTDDQPARDTLPERETLDIDAQFSWSQNEVLRAKDFEQMDNAEIADAVRAVRGLRLNVPKLVTRRHRPAASGRQLNTREILRRALRKGGEIDHLSFKKPRQRPRDLVAICDISGSMSVYARMMMHFLHTLVWAPEREWGKVSGFTFGTQLTNITRSLRLKDVDQALASLGKEAPDWQGGTRIGAALRQFNRDWSRRVLGQGSVVLLITDGLERGDTAMLAAQAERLSLSCQRLIWLNPLLRWQDFAPKAAGIRTLLPRVDSFHSCHSLDSLADIGTALTSQSEQRRLLQMI